MPSVVDGENGFVVWDDAQFKARLAQLLADPRWSNAWGGLGRHDEGLNWERVAPLWQQRIVECAEVETVTRHQRKLLSLTSVEKSREAIEVLARRIQALSS